MRSLGAQSELKKFIVLGIATHPKPDLWLDPIDAFHQLTEKGRSILDGEVFSKSRAIQNLSQFHRGLKGKKQAALAASQLKRFTGVCVGENKSAYKNVGIKDATQSFAFENGFQDFGGHPLCLGFGGNLIHYLL